MTKISAMPIITGAAVDPAADILPILDMSLAGDARNKRITVAALAEALASAPDRVMFATRGALAAVEAPANGKAAWLTEAGREGLFVFSSANLTAAVAADALQGLTVPPAAAPTGANGAWVRRGYTTARPEWWGLKVNDGADAVATANLAAWNACKALAKHRTMPLGTIWTSSSIIIDDAYSTTVFPVHGDGYSDASGTRILSKDKTKDALIIGPDAQPAAVGANPVANFPRNVTVINPAAGFGVALDALAGSAEALRKAVRINYLIDGFIDNPWGHEAPIGIFYYGLVGTRVTHAKAFRSAAIAGADKFFSHWFKGSPAILAGGNASLNVDSLAAEMASGMALTDECGIVFEGAFSDVRIKRAETSDIKNGMRVTGTGPAGEASSNINFRVDELIVDKFRGIAIDIQSVAQNGSVQVNNFEVMSAAGAAHGVRIKDCYGLVHVDGTVHGLGASAGAGTMTGLRVENSYGVSGKVRLIDCPNPVELDVLYDFDLDLTVNNVTVTSNPVQAAVYYTQLHRGTLKVRIKGAAAVFPQGVYGPAADCDHVTFLGLDMIDPLCISGGAANKLQISGTQIAAQGFYTPAGLASAAGSMTVVGGLGASAPANTATEVVSVLVSDPAGSAITVGDGKVYWRVPSTMNGMNLVGVAAALTTASSAGIPTAQIHNVTQAADMLTTKLTIDVGETDSSTAAAAAVIDAANDDVATGNLLRIDIDVAGTGAKGLIIEMQFRLPA